MEHNDVIEINLLKLVEALLKKAWLIALVTVIVAGAVFGYAKMTYAPKYTAAVTMCVKGTEKDVTYTVSSAEIRINTLVAFLDTQTVLEEVSEASGLELAPEAVAKMIKAEAINKSEMMLVTATGLSRKDAAQLANATAEVLRKNSECIYGEDSLAIFESASETTALEKDSGTIQKAVVAAVLAACLVCAGIVAKELSADWKAAARKDA